MADEGLCTCACADDDRDEVFSGSQMMEHDSKETMRKKRVSSQDTNGVRCTCMS